MYLASDPRSTLAASAASSSAAPTAYKGSDYLKFYEVAASDSDALAVTWIGRGQDFLVAYSQAEPGAELVRTAQDDEYLLMLPDAATRVLVEAGDESQEIDGYSLTMIPPGPSRIRVLAGGVVIRLLTTRATDLADKALNAANYVEPDPNVAPFQAWPDPVDGFRIRSYSLDVTEEPGRFGRIWRSTNFMLNIFYPQGPRDETKMSPHHHDDFQQGSLMLEGEGIHHLRWAWGPDKTIWREDEHTTCGAPSLAILPPPAIHTTQMLAQNNLMIDIFCPPRLDFSQKPGWVLNAHDYPMPEGQDQ